VGTDRSTARSRTFVRVAAPSRTEAPTKLPKPFEAGLFESALIGADRQREGEWDGI
jgi:hypothetical protein